MVRSAAERLLNKNTLIPSLLSLQKEFFVCKRWGSDECQVKSLFVKIAVVLEEVD